MMSLWDKVVQFFKDWGTNPLVDVLAGALITLIGVFFRQIWRFVKGFFSWLWALLRGHGADHSFERRYLDWLIGQHRHLGLLPAQILTQNWKGGQRFFDLEKIYVKLSMSAQSGDEGWAETYGKGENSWRKRPWPSSRFIPFVRWYYRLIFFFIIASIIASLVWISILFLSSNLTFSSLKDSYLGQIMQHNPPYFWLPFIILISSAVFCFIKYRSSIAKYTYQIGDLGLVVDRHKRLVIRGDPGSGKSTLLRYLALTCARTLRKNKRDGDLPHLVEQRLQWNTHPFPIFVTLGRYGKVTSWDESKELIDIFREEMPRELNNKCPKDFFQKRLASGDCLILLDGFDELGSPEARSAMARRISGFLENYKHPGNRIVVTTRIVGYEGQLDRYGFTVRTVQNLNAGEIRALVKLGYEAFIASETAWRHSQEEARAIRQRLLRRSGHLVGRIEHDDAHRLSQLATNPMLLSLIVLVHYLQFDLPEERLLLYRDCVEILTTRWQQVRREEAGIVRSEEQDQLTLSQKFLLLGEIAITMQKQRKEEGNQAFLPKDVVRDLIARKLPDFFGLDQSYSENIKQEMYRRRAEEWIETIRGESGILVEQGFDESGEPLIGFSHLTFQEYLAAVIINEVSAYRRLLRENKLKPAWREVVLLYVALTSDPSSLIESLVNSDQHEGILLSGYCSAEHLKKTNIHVQQLVLTKIKEGLSQAVGGAIDDFGKVMGALEKSEIAALRSEITAFMRTQLSNPLLEKRLVAIKALGKMRQDDPDLVQVQQNLVQIVETSNDVELVVGARESLAQIGDPRFSANEPIMVRIPPQLHGFSSSPRVWKELKASSVWAKANIWQRMELVGRVMDRWFFTRLIWRRKSQNYEFEIGKYLVTNLEYSRFTEATGYRTPNYWIEGTFPLEEATHPVVDITFADAQEYCKWLTKQTGNQYRLPTEWEWEWAAAGPHGWVYPWGDDFDQDKCNTVEGSKEKTTPVGSYKAGASIFGASDMVGNVWEYTKGILIALSSLPFLFIIIAMIIITIFRFDLSGYVTILISGSVSSLYGLFRTVFEGVSRGGAWNSSCKEATCFNRKLTPTSKFIGFRCLKEL
jgi:energy-coupling factor transporter ATP-binding protein EcfA2